MRLRDPNALIQIAVEPKVRDQQAELVAALQELAKIVVLDVDEDAGQTVIAGPDEMTLDRAVGFLNTQHGLAMHVGAPEIAYLETVRRQGSTDYTHKASGQTPTFARVVLSVEPDTRGGGFVSELADDALPAEFVAAVARAVEDAFRAGPVAGFPVVDVLVKLHDAAFHATDSTPDAFHKAGLGALRHVLVVAGTALLEPLMTLTVTAPADCAGDVAQDLRARRGRHLVSRAGDGRVELTAVVSLANTFGYANTLASISGGRATFSMTYARHEIVGGGPDDSFSPAAAMRA